MSPIEGYKSAIAVTLKPGGTNVGSDPHLCRLINSFYMKRLVERNLSPHWDLSVVLGALTKPPFEPRNMASVELKFLTFKMVFPLSL